MSMTFVDKKNSLLMFLQNYLIYTLLLTLSLLSSNHKIHSIINEIILMQINIAYEEIM